MISSSSLQAGLRERSKAHKHEAQILRETLEVLKDAACIFEKANETDEVRRALGASRGAKRKEEEREGKKKRKRGDGRAHLLFVCHVAL